MPVLFLESRDGQCRYPVSDEPNLEMMVCGEPAQDGSSYCPACHRLAYLPVKRTSAVPVSGWMRENTTLARSKSGDPRDLTEVIR